VEVWMAMVMVLMLAAVAPVSCDSDSRGASDGRARNGSVGRQVGRMGWAGPF
jgi:hypothetical protein